MNNKMFLFIFAVLLVSLATASEVCLNSDSLGDSTSETINVGSDEIGLQTVLNNNGYSLNASEDQTNIQIWKAERNVDIEVNILG